MARIQRIEIAGFKSIHEQEVELRDLNVLIGANGAGKSNFIALFELLRHMYGEDLQLFVAKSGGAHQMLFLGRKRTEKIRLRLYFEPNEYGCELVPSQDDGFVYENEWVAFQGPGYSRPYDEALGSGHLESKLREAAGRKKIADYVLRSFAGWKIYHFHDTSASSRIKQTGALDDNEFLRPDAANLAAYLYRLEKKEPHVFQSITDATKMVAPFFAEFHLRPNPLNEGTIQLEWREKGTDDYFNAHVLSDGTLRFIALATLLLQADEQLPDTILLDEPELGLHPYAISILAELLQQAAKRAQIIVCTQSVTLVNQLAPEDVIVVDRVDGESKFRRLSEEDVDSWLEDYGLGDLWEKNVLGGRPQP